jgi:hypothetical protein
VRRILTDGDEQLEARWWFLAEVVWERRQVLTDLTTVRSIVVPDSRAFSFDNGELLRWARRWNLDCPWMLATARDTLRIWNDLPSIRGRDWDYSYSQNGPEDAEGQLISNDSRGRRRKFQPEKRRTYRHFTWLVKSQIPEKSGRQVLTYRQIWKQELPCGANSTDDTSRPAATVAVIRDAVVGLRSALGLPEIRK